MPVLRETGRALRTSPVFAFYALVALAVAGYIGLMVGQMAFGLDLWLPGLFGQMQHGAIESHRVHDFTFALLITTGIVGILAQLRRPSRNVAGMVMALIPFAALALAGVLSDEFEIVVRRNPSRLIGAVVAVTSLLHPAGRRFFGSFRLARVNWMLLALVGGAAVPLVGFASTNIDLQSTVRDDHFFLGHYAFMAALSFTIIGVGLLASLRPDGWRLAACVARLLPGVLGLISLIYPDVSSRLDRGWAVAAMAWGAVFIAVAERTKDVEGLTLLGGRAVVSASTSG